jgi:ABC-type glycerol-3-phosphate transport system permease component
MKADSLDNPSGPVHALLSGLTYAALVGTSLLMLTPFAWLVCASLKAPEIYFESPFLPRGEGLLGVAWDKLTFAYFADLFGGKSISFGNNILNSVFYASVTAVLATLFSAMGGYALAKFQFRLRGPVTLLVLSSLLIPGSLLLAPGYQLLFKLNLLDSFAGLILPGLAPAFGVFLFRQTMINAVPLDLLEAARIDGAGEFRTFFTIVLPLVRPMLGAFLLITFLGCWNNFIGPQIVLQSPEKFPLAVAIAQLKGLYSTNYGLLMAGTIVSIAPVMALFLLLQKEFIAGLTSGAVKG